jgi:hypothetical protein
MGSRENLSALGGAFAPWENDCNLLAYRTSPRVNIFLVKNPLVPSMNIPHAVRTCLVFQAFFLYFAVCGQAALITTPVTSSEFATVFSIAASKPVTGSGAVWYAQFQAGNTSSTSNTFEQWEVEIGNVSGATDYGHTSWVGNQTYDFSISVNSANKLTAIFNDGSSADDSGYRISDPFNEIWIQLVVDTNVSTHHIDITNHEVDSLALSNMSVGGDTVDDYASQAFKFHFDDKLSNIGQFDLSGDAFLFVVGDTQQWTYTAVGVYNPDLIPEPNSLLLLLVGGVASLLLQRRARM